MSRTGNHYLPPGYFPGREFQYRRPAQPVGLPPSGMTRTQRLEPHMGHPQVQMGHPQARIGHSQALIGHPQSPNYLEKQQNLAIREAFRKERKLDSYLAEDENFPCFANQLKKIGLQLRDIPADGNCLFRALGDQLEGHCRNHYRHRQEISQFMLNHRRDFEPFVEDEVPFEDYINNLKKLGTHAGNDAIVAFSRLHNVTVMIHQLKGKPLLIPAPSPSPVVRQVHIAYHNGDHYSSVRRDGDNTESPAHITLQENNNAMSAPAQVPAPSQAREEVGVVMAVRGLDQLEAEVMRATGCKDVKTVQETLKINEFDVDATIATLLQTLDLQKGADDTTSLGSHKTTDSGVWGANGTNGHTSGGASTGGSLKSKGQKVHFREDSFGGSSGYSSMGSNRGGGARPKLFPAPAQVQYQIITGHRSKDIKKLEKKRRL